MSDHEPHLIKPWPDASRFGASHDHLHAVGAISLAYNRLEHTMSYLFSDYIAANPAIGESIYARLTNRARIDVFREIIEVVEGNPKVRDYVRHAIHCFEDCGANRNTLLHLIHDFDDDRPSEFLAGKKLNANKTKELFYSVSVDDLRSVAESMEDARRFALSLSFYLFRRQGEKNADVLSQILRDENFPPKALPEKPSRPRMLNPLQPQAGRSGD